MRRWLTLLAQVLGAVFSGLMLYAGYEPTGLWWAAPLGFAVFFFIVTARRAVLLAFVQALALYVFMLPWIGEFVGASAWIGLAVVESLYALLFGLGLRYLLRWRAQVAGQSEAKSRTGLAALSAGKDWVTVLGAGAFFVAVEWFRSSWPFGGFGWGRLAWSQASGPLASIIRLGGAASVTLAVVIVGGAVYLAIRPQASNLVVTVPQRVSAASVAVGLLLVSFVYGESMDRDSSNFEAAPLKPNEVNVAAIQGNVPRAGLDFAAQRRAVLMNHVRRTVELAEQVERGERESPDVVVWPENSSDVNPFKDEQAKETITAAVDAIGAPTFVGTVLGDENTMLTWSPSGSDESGPGERHVKKFLQPFGEYMPFRDILKHVNEHVARAGDMKPGNGSGVVDMDTPLGQIPMGASTCYEISFDASPREAVANGAEFLTSPTNNATFGFTDMSYQQLAMSRMRAVETDRAVVVAATSGVSAIVLPNGDVVEQSRLFEPAILQATIPLRSTMTPSIQAGSWVEWGIAGLGLLTVIAAFVSSRQNRSKG